MPQYSTGNIIVEHGSDMIKGIDTKFISNAKSGDLLYVKYSEENILGPFVIDRIVEDRVLYITESFGGTSAFRVKFAITNAFTTNYELPRVSTGDMVISKSILETMLLLEDILSMGSIGFDKDFLYSITFEYNEYHISTQTTYFEIKLVGLPGNIEYSNELFSSVKFRLTNNDDDRLIINYQSNGLLVVDTSTIENIYNPVYIEAYFDNRSDLSAVCKVYIKNDSISVPITEFNVPAYLDVPTGGSTIITPSILPLNADDNDFIIRSTGIYFYNYFDVKTSSGRSIEISGKSSSESFTSYIDIGHIKEKGSADFENKRVSLLNTRAALKINSLSFATDEIEITSFGKREFSILSNPQASSGSSWGADYRTFISSITSIGETSNLIKTKNIYIDPLSNNKLIFDIEPNYTNEDARTNSILSCLFTIIIKILNERSGLSASITIRFKYTPTGNSYSCSTIKNSYMIGEIFKVIPLPENTGTSNKQTRITLNNTDAFIPLNYKIQDGNNYYYEEGSDILMKPIAEGSANITPSSWFSSYLSIAKSITITPFTSYAYPATAISLKHDLRNVDVTPTDASAFVGLKTNYYVTFTPSNTSLKAIKVSTSTPGTIKLKQEYYVCEDGTNRIDISFISRQQGEGNIKVETLDGSNISIDVTFAITGTSAPVNMISIGPDYLHAVDYETNAPLSYEYPYLDSVKILKGTAKIIKVPILFNPTNATLKYTRFYISGKSFGAILHPTEVTNVSYKSEATSYVLIDVSKYNGYGAVKIGMRGVYNDLEAFFYIN